MRYDLKKILFVGLKEERESFFEQAQSLGIIHFIENKALLKEIPQAIQAITAAIKIIRTLPLTEQEELEDYALTDAIVEEVLKLKQEADKLSKEKRLIKIEMSRIEIFGDFSLEELHKIEKEIGRKAHFYFAKQGYEETTLLPENLIYVDSDHGLDYFVAFDKQPQSYPKMIEMLIEQPLGELRKKAKLLKNALHKTEQQLKFYAKYNTFLHHALIQKLNIHNLQTTKNAISWQFDQALFVIEGWVPINQVDSLQQMVNDLNVHMEEIAYKEDEVPPTYLENAGISRLGEDLVNIYDTPSAADKDPSLWVLFFFALFFAFIIGDGGYGLIFLGAALYIRYKYALSKSSLRLVNLVTILGAACIGWGVLTTSFFGVPLDIDNPLRKISLTQWLAEKKASYLIEKKDAEWQEWIKKFPDLKTVSDPHLFLKEGKVEKEGKISYEILDQFSNHILFELAILIGVVHLMLSLLRYVNRNLASAGWVLFLIGAYLYFPYFLHVNSMIHYVLGVNPEEGSRNGLYLMFGGMGLATVIALIKHRLLGLLEPMQVIQIFADTMSYLRLYALGLSGAMLISTMNDLAGSVHIVFGIVIIILGHIVNMVLCVMSGVIHGLRLNFLEWYHYSFEGGGKPFNPLRKLTID